MEKEENSGLSMSWVSIPEVGVVSMSIPPFGKVLWFENGASQFCAPTKTPNYSLLSCSPCFPLPLP